MQPISFLQVFFRSSLLGALCSLSAQAAPRPAGDAEAHFQQNSQQQQAQQTRFGAHAPDISLSADAPSRPLIFPQETPCFVIRQVTLSGTERLPRWVPLQRLANRATGHCLGAEGINQLVSGIQNRLIGHGWITTRLLVPEQDLSSGYLRLVVIPGKIEQISLAEGSAGFTTLYTAVPAHKGNLLDLRDIEQGLENLQRLPGVRATVELVPGEGPGETRVIIDRQQPRFWRTGAWLDNTGSKYTGKNQAGVMLALDNLSSLSDLFYITASRDLSFAAGRHTANYSLHYSVPLGYWQFSTTGSEYQYKQTLASNDQNISYQGRSKSLDLQLSKVLFRSAGAKTTAAGDLILRETRSLVQQTEAESQRRRTTAWKFAVDHRQFVGRATLNAGASYQRGVPWLGAKPAPESYQPQESENYATARAIIMQLSASAGLPFAVGEQAFRFDSHYLRQVSRRGLTPQDRFSIGSRWTVRGFDGERILSADEGWSLRNTLSWATPLPAQELYLGADYGRISGGFKKNNLGSHLAGGVIGLRGAIVPANLSYDLQTGTPLSKPDGFKTDHASLAFSVNWNY